MVHFTSLNCSQRPLSAGLFTLLTKGCSFWVFTATAPVSTKIQKMFFFRFGTASSPTASWTPWPTAARSRRATSSLGRTAGPGTAFTNHTKITNTIIEEDIFLVLVSGFRQVNSMQVEYISCVYIERVHRARRGRLLPRDADVGDAPGRVPAEEDDRDGRVHLQAGLAHGNRRQNYTSY
jgi:hypothetical protein